MKSICRTIGSTELLLPGFAPEQEILYFMKDVYQRKRRTIRNLRIIAFILLGFQAMGYIGSLNKEEENVPEEISLSIAFQIGFNIFLIAAVILFIIAFAKRKQLKRQVEHDEIDSLGKNE